MLTLIADLPKDVVGVEAHGKVTADDYERVLIPAVDARRRLAVPRRSRLRLAHARRDQGVRAAGAEQRPRTGDVDAAPARNGSTR
jgi:hypothetical protein